VIVTRRALADDAFAIAVIHVESWQAVYRGLMPSEILDRLDVAERTEMWRKVLAGFGSDVLVVDDGSGQIAGFCSLIRSGDADSDSKTGEIAAIYVDPRRWRIGLGAALLGDALKLAQARDFIQVTLWVLDANLGARRFYERAGFRLDGLEKMENRWGTFSVREVRYRLPIASGAT